MLKKWERARKRTRIENSGYSDGRVGGRKLVGDRGLADRGRPRGNKGVGVVSLRGKEDGGGHNRGKSSSTLQKSGSSSSQAQLQAQAPLYRGPLS